MTTEIKVPELPESVADATVSEWYKKSGEFVKQDEKLVDLETDKIMLEVPAPEDGVLEKILKDAGETVNSQEVLALLDTSKKPEEKAEEKPEEKPKKEAAKPKEKPEKEEAKPEEAPKEEEAPKKEKPKEAPPMSPSVRRLIAEHKLDIDQIKPTGKGGRILKEDVEKAIEAQSKAKEAAERKPTEERPREAEEARPEKRVPMSRMRTRIAERLLEVTQNTAMLTTFNEVNMKPIMDLRARYKENFQKQHEVKLGLMSFFVKASVEALKRFPVVNASIDGTDIVYHGYFDIGIAVSTERGLVVPILQDADQMSMADIEKKIIDFGQRAQAGKLGLEELQGGTFSITNGGIFGSMLSTPILNPPQSAILGMHNIVKRAVVENDEIVIRPMMYLALSYDHRIIDGRDAVTFLLNIKQVLEDPARLLLNL